MTKRQRAVICCFVTTLVVCATIPVPILAADKPAAPPADKPQSAPPATPAQPAPPAPSGRADWDRPVGMFLQSPAALLLTPQEVVQYDGLDNVTARRVFIERFWGSMANNCPVGENPTRDLILARVVEANDKFGDEGIPGWLTDRGRVYILLGPPASEVKKGEGAGAVLVWSWAEAPDRPKTVAFARDRLQWTFAGVDQVDPAAASVTAHPSPVAPAAQKWAALLRQQGCELTPEQRAQAATVAWRKTLYDLAGRVLAGEKPEVANALEPNWHFFPAEGGATFVALTVPLETNPEAGGLPVAVLRMEGAEESTFSMGSTEVPFVARETGAGWVAQAVRALPAGRYAFALGLNRPDGETAPRAVGEQLIVRITNDTLRLTPVVLADKIEPAKVDDTPGPFHLFGFDVTPNARRSFKAGSPVTLFYLALGATTDAAGKVDLKVSYQIFFNRPGKGWIPAMPTPVVSPHQEQAVQAREFQIPPRWPAGDYKVLIEVTDNATGGQVTQEAAFKVKPGP